MAPSRRSVSSGIIRLKREGWAEECECLIRIAGHSRMRMGQGAQIEVISVEAVRPFPLSALDLGLAQARLDRADDAQGDLVLQFEDVVERPIVALGPDMRAAGCRDQLR